MSIGTVCSRGVCISRPGVALAAAARDMIERHVGAIVVVDSRSGVLAPVGIVTDRDIVCRQLAATRDMFYLTVDEVMTANVLTLNEDCGIAAAVGRMSAWGVRRAPVVDAAGNLVGMVTLDDLLPTLARNLSGVAELIGKQSHREGRPAADPSPRREQPAALDP